VPKLGLFGLIDEILHSISGAIKVFGSISLAAPKEDQQQHLKIFYTQSIVQLICFNGVLYFIIIGRQQATRRIGKTRDGEYTRYK
jgi:hypothetical protein